MLGILLPLIFSINTGADQLATCEFYKNKARELQCSEDNYLMRFGYRYCRAFARSEKDFSSEGRKALRFIRACLIQTLKDNNKVSCASAENIALRSHYDCYIAGGYCDFSFGDKFTLFDIVGEELLDEAYGDVALELEDYCFNR
jgi:hypothetical protein